MNGDSSLKSREPFNTVERGNVIRIPMRRAGEHSPPAPPEQEAGQYPNIMADQEKVSFNDTNGAKESLPQGDAGCESEDELRERLIEIEAQYRQTLADSNNFRRRVERESRRQSLNEKRAFLAELLEIMDNFERALNLPPDGNDAWCQGIEAIHRQVVELLERHGVQPIDALGETFDPHYHEAVSTAFNPNIKNGTVIEEIRKGYVLNGELIRPSRVRVAVNS